MSIILETYYPAKNPTSGNFCGFKKVRKLLTTNPTCLCCYFFDFRQRDEKEKERLFNTIIDCPLVKSCRATLMENEEENADIVVQMAGIFLSFSGYKKTFSPW